MVKSLFVAVSLFLLTATSLAQEFPASQLCVHNDCLGGTNYCVVRYSYGTINAGVIDNKRYLVPQDTTMTEVFRGTCVPNGSPTPTPCPSPVAGSITNAGSGDKCLDNANSSLNPNNPIVLYSCGQGQPNQTWMYKDGTISLANSEMYCLDTRAVRGSFDNVVLNRCGPGVKSQQWTITASGVIKNAASGKCVNIKDGATADNTPIITYRCGNPPGNNEVWTVPAGWNCAA